MKRPMMLLGLLVILLIGGCAAAEWMLDDTVPVGRDFDLTAARQIKDGVTTKAEIEQKFGQADGVSSTEQMETWVYTYQRVSPGRQKTWGKGTNNPHTTRTETTVRYEKKLIVVFNENGIVAHHQVSEAGKR